MKTILFLSTHNLVTNPRLVKEINLTLQLNYRVEVICYIFRNWSYDLNNNLLEEFKEKGVKFYCIEAGREAFAAWLKAALKEKYYQALAHIISLKNGSLANAVSRRNIGLIEAIKKIQSADWVIGHNPGALWATCFAGKKLNCKMGFDVEDYHPGEGNNTHEQQLTKKLMQDLLPLMNYVSFAAPLILEQVLTDVGRPFSNWIPILNYFPAAEFRHVKNIHEGPLRFVWFSQHINKGRGLEMFLTSVKANIGKAELHLYGNVDEEFKIKYLDGFKNIILHGVVSAAELNLHLESYDVGLALDIPVDKNRDIVITNKLISYLQAGLYVLYTNTRGQESFMKNHPSMGFSVDYKKSSIPDIVGSLIVNKDDIRFKQQYRSEFFTNNNWENESQKLYKILSSD